MEWKKTKLAYGRFRFFVFCCLISFFNLFWLIIFVSFLWYMFLEGGVGYDYNCDVDRYIIRVYFMGML